MTPTRIAPATAADIGIFANLLRVVVGFFTKLRVGRVTTPIAVMSHHPFVLGGYAAMEQNLTWAQRVPRELKSYLNLRAASLIGCPF